MLECVGLPCENNHTHCQVATLPMHRVARQRLAKMEKSSSGRIIPHFQAPSNSFCNFKIVVGVNDISDTCDNCNVIWKHLWFPLMWQNHGSCPYYKLIVTLVIEGNAMFQIQDTENEAIILPYLCPWPLRLLFPRPRGPMDPVKNLDQ